MNLTLVKNTHFNKSKNFYFKIYNEVQSCNPVNEYFKFKNKS